MGSPEVLNRFGARQYWKKLRPVWSAKAEGVVDKAFEIEDSDVRTAVLGIFRAIASDKGAFVLEQAAGGFRIAQVELDDDAYDEILAQVDESRFSEAFAWIVRAVRDLPSPLLAWAFGELRLADGHERSADGKYLMPAFASERVVYSVEKRKLTGILSHETFYSPGCKVLEIEFD